MIRPMLDDFINDARRYARDRGITLVTLGVYAVQDSRLFRRLESGGQCLPRTIDRVRAYMTAHPAIPAASADNPNQETSHDNS